MNIITRNIPNSITCVNVLAGCMSVIMAFKGTSPVWGLAGYEWAFIFIAIAAAADFLDGFAARLLHAYSELGKELDSLCDLVSFGVAPAMVLVNTVAPASPSQWIAWCALLIPVSCAVRLARFNLDTRQTTGFIGMPVPANAIFWIGYVATLMSGASCLAEWYVFLPVLAVECWLMNSPVPLLSLKFHTWGWKGNAPRWILIMGAVAFMATLGVPGLLWFIIFYVVLSCFFARKG